MGLEGVEFPSTDGLFFLVTSPHLGATQEPTQSHIIRTKNTLTTQEITRVLELCARNRVGAETNLHFLLSHSLNK